jgi:uncharacterized membrane protein
MIGIITLILWFIALLIASKFTYILYHKRKKAKISDDEMAVQKVAKQQDIAYTFVVSLSVLGAFIIYHFFIKNTIYQSHFFEWLNLAIRWIHITFGIAWIGASFYFVFLENALNRTKNVRDELAGNLWAVHGGGFYYVEKYKLAPKEIPKDLHWFKYEAYFTWLTGFCLLFVVYYFNAKSYLIDPEVLDIEPLTAIAIGVGSLIVGWVIYDLICKKLITCKIIFTIAITVFLIFFAWFYSQVFSGRAAYIHFGALIGTLMAANVFFIIIPGQKRMVNAAKKGLAPNPADGEAAFIRSYSNNYFTLPVLFIMISNHFPSTFGNVNQWLILLIISLGSAGIKHYLNLREKEQLSVWVLPFSILLLLTAAFVTSPTPIVDGCKEEVNITQVNAIVQNRCVTCHSATPTDLIWKVAPNGVKFDTPQQIINFKDKIFQRVVVSKDMPFANQTKITDEERATIECWINQGAQK